MECACWMLCVWKGVCACLCLYTIKKKYQQISSQNWPLPLNFLGAGVGPTIQIGEQTVITVDAKAAGKGKVTCSVCTPEGAELDVDVVENEDGTFDIFYTAPQPGEYIICVRFGGEHIPNSPFQVTVSDILFNFYIYKISLLGIYALLLQHPFQQLSKTPETYNRQNKWITKKYW